MSPEPKYHPEVCGLATLKNSARRSNGSNAKAALRRQVDCYAAALGRVRCCTCKQTRLAVGCVNVAEGLKAVT